MKWKCSISMTRRKKGVIKKIMVGVYNSEKERHKRRVGEETNGLKIKLSRTVSTFFHRLHLINFRQTLVIVKNMANNRTKRKQLFYLLIIPKSYPQSSYVSHQKISTYCFNELSSNLIFHKLLYSAHFFCSRVLCYELFKQKRFKPEKILVL